MGMKFMNRNKDVPTTPPKPAKPANSVADDAAETSLSGENKWTVVADSSSPSSSEQPAAKKPTLAQSSSTLPLPRFSAGGANLYVENLVASKLETARSDKKFKKAGGVTDSEMVDFMVDAGESKSKNNKKSKRKAGE